MSELIPQIDYDKKPPSLGGERRYRFELRSPYGPDGEPWLKGRSYAAHVLRAIGDDYKDMQEQDPDLHVGMTVYGSAVKGRFTEESDLDLKLFIDPDVAAVRGTDTESIGDEARRYLESGLLGSGLAHELEGPPKVTIAVPMNVAFARGLAECALSDLRLLREKLETHGDVRVTFPHALLGDGLISIFHMQLNRGRRSGINDCRRQILDSLQSSGKDGEIVWRSIATWLVDLEEGRRGASIYFPDTIEKAYAYFGLNTPEFTMFELGGDGVQELTGGGAVRLLGSARKVGQNATADV